METFSRRVVLYRKRGRSCSYRPSPVDAFEQHRELRAAQRDHSFVRLRPYEAAPFETFGEQAESVAVPPEQLDQIATLAAENENVARERVLFEHSLCDGAQACEAAPQVRDAGGDPDARAGRQRDHRLRCSRMTRRFSGSAEPSTRTWTLPTSMWMAPEYALAGLFSP